MDIRKLQSSYRMEYEEEMLLLIQHALTSGGSVKVFYVLEQLQRIGYGYGIGAECRRYIRMWTHIYPALKKYETRPEIMSDVCLKNIYLEGCLLLLEEYEQTFEMY